MTSSHSPEVQQEKPSDSKFKTFWPLIVIVGMILLVSIVSALNAPAFDWSTFFRYFMAGFFLVFSGFKIMNLKGFRDGYSTYDLLAMRVPAYAYLYPFIELALGLAYLTSFQLFYVNLVTLILMLFSGIGVVIKLMKREKIQCACLGTIIQVPLTNITVVEDFSMAIMAAAMLLI